MKKTREKVMGKVRTLALPVSTAIMVGQSTICTLAAEADIDLASITAEAMTQIKADLLTVISASAAVSVSLVGLTVGISYLIKKAKALKNTA